MDKVEDTLLVVCERERSAPMEINPEQYAKALHQIKRSSTSPPNVPASSKVGRKDLKGVQESWMKLPSKVL